MSVFIVVRKQGAIGWVCQIEEKKSLLILCKEKKSILKLNDINICSKLIGDDHYG